MSTIQIYPNHCNLQDAFDAHLYVKKLFAMAENNPEAIVAIDTETTGFSKKDVIIEICAVDMAGTVVMETLANSKQFIQPSAQEVHGITPAKLAGAPALALVMRDVLPILKERETVYWNASFDLRMLEQSMKRCSSNPEMVSHIFAQQVSSHCLQKLYARIYGEPQARAKSKPKVQKLRAACEQQGIEWDDSQAHRATYDTEKTVELLAYLALTEIEHA